tara:strand:+ start:172 stop:804 length:633 start_codon:yes stop_codon:yes gene_type:complete
MTVRYPLIAKIFCLSLIFFIGGCVVLKGERTFSKRGLTVTFRSLNALDDVQKIRFRYPIILSEATIRNHLLSLWFQDIIAPKAPRAVFSPRVTSKLAPLFKTVLRKVKPGKYLHFTYQASRGLTEGLVFVTPKNIHWRFFKINGVGHSNDPLRIRKPTWQLVRMNGQSYQKFRTGGFEKTIRNRLIAKINIPFPKHKYPARSKKKPFPRK